MFSLNYRDARPIYEQVLDGFRRLIVSGAIQPGEKLPSVRALAGELAINPNTIQRAYELLEGEGYVVSVPGKGTFAADPAAAKAGWQSQWWEQLEQAARELLAAGVTPEELQARLKSLTEKGAEQA